MSEHKAEEIESNSSHVEPPFPPNNSCFRLLDILFLEKEKI